MRLTAINRFLAAPWVYLSASYILGFAFGAQTLRDFLEWPFWYPLAFFAISGSVFLTTLGQLLSDKTTEPWSSYLDHYRKQVLLVMLSAASGVPLLFLLTHWAYLFYLAFIILAVCYYVRPIRFKGRPFLAAAATFVYALPGLVAYSQIADQRPEVWAIGAAFCWLFAMALFAEIVTLDDDTQAQKVTTVTLLGRKNSLWLCCGMFTLAIIDITSFGTLFALAFVYPLLPFILIFRKPESITTVYQWLPLITVLMYGGLLWYAIGQIGAT